MMIGFHDPSPVELVGRKGHNLSRMWQAGLPVPAGFCVPYQHMDTIGEIELGLALQPLNATAFSVRSSAFEEDASAASFAGMLRSHLNVRGAAAVLTRVQDVRRSTGAAAAYSERLNLGSSPRVAAVVHAFVPAEASGVLFSRPGSGDFLVEASWGLGPAIVEGLVRPDRWVISADGAVVSAHIADKDVAIVAAETEGTTQILVDPPCRRRPCLTVEDLGELSRLAAACERLFNAPQDIEWAVHDEQVWLLQSRPITKW
jgi:pyruvate,water dikinase